MENVISEKSQMATIFGKLLAGAFIFESPEFKPESVKRTISKVAKWIGEDTLKELLNSSSDKSKALLFACIEMTIVGKLSPETKDLFRKLEATDRVVIEVAYLRLTGQDFSEGSRPKWSPVLWKLKNMCQKYIELSPSDIKEDELAQVLKAIAIPFFENVRIHVLKTL
jgi:hypothetical protein